MSAGGGPSTPPGLYPIEVGEPIRLQMFFHGNLNLAGKGPAIEFCEAARFVHLVCHVHGKITVLDRADLEAAAGGCFRAVKADFDHLLG